MTKLRFSLLLIKMGDCDKIIEYKVRGICSDSEAMERKSRILIRL
jgi:hypothetical protein